MPVNDEKGFWQALQCDLKNTIEDIPRLRSELKAGDLYAEFFLKRMMIACENTVGCVLLGRKGFVVPVEAATCCASTP